MDASSSAIAAVLAGIAAGWVARSELQRKRDRRVLRTAVARREAAALRGPDWPLRALRQILAGAEPGEIPYCLLVTFTDRYGQRIAAEATIRDGEPRRYAATTVALEDGTAAAGLVALEVPDDVAELGDAG